MNYSKSELRRMYELLVQGRKYEEKVLQWVNQGKVQGFFHLALGQEAAQIGMVCALGPDDYILPTHRFHPGLTVREDLKALTAELLGKSSGTCRGKAFTFHYSNKANKILPVSADGMLGVGAPTSVGYAWALKADNKEGVVVTVAGDGTCGEGNVHEAMNIAGILKVPIIFYIENNGWAISNPLSNNNAVSQLSLRAAGYDMPAINCDGNDIISVRNAMEEALDMARKNQPVVVEAVTHRWRGHFEGDPQVYRDPSDIKEAQKHDCVKNFEKVILDQNVATKNELDEIAADVQKRIDEAFEYAEKCKLPTLEETLDFDQVYASNLGGALL